MQSLQKLLLIILAVSMSISLEATATENVTFKKQLEIYLKNRSSKKVILALGAIGAITGTGGFLFYLQWLKQSKLNAQDNHGNTPLHTAVRNKNSSQVKQLLKDGADPNILDHYQITPFYEAVMEGKTEIVKLFLNNPKTNIEAQGPFGKTPFIKAAENNAVDIMQILIDAGANINAQDKFGETSLHYAINTEALDAINFLLQKKAAINIQTINGITPLIRAVTTQRPALLAQLLDAGADVSIKDKDNKTAVDWAREQRSFLGHCNSEPLIAVFKEKRPELFKEESEDEE